MFFAVFARRCDPPSVPTCLERLRGGEASRVGEKKKKKKKKKPN